MRRAAALVPARLEFPAAAARADAWGRLLALSAYGASLSTAAPLARGERMLLDFDAAGERFRGLRVEVLRAERDADGHVAAELRFADEVERRRLARALLDALSRTP